MNADTAAVAFRDRLPVPGALVPDPKVQSRHLGQQALIYVRQSHPNQVQRHPESARRQYGLVERAVHLARELDREVATPDEARAMLNLKGKDTLTVD